MINKLRTKEKGFTIVEVVIVLAIAGVIMLVVFLAVPALQRNSRNTTRKSEVGRIASAVTNFVSNNNGKLPTTAADVTTIMNDVGALNAYTGLTPAAAQPAAMAQGKINLASGAIATAPTIAITGTAPTDAIEIDTAAACGSGGVTTAGPSTKAIAILYTLEPGSGANYTIACQDI